MKRVICVLEYMVCLFIVLDNRSVFSRIPDIGKYILPITAMLIIMLVAFNFIFKMIEWKRMAKSLLALCFFYLFFTIYLMVNVFETRSYILTFMICFTFLFIYYATNKNENVAKGMLIKYENIILIISIVSLIFYVLSSTLKLIESTNIVQTNWGDKRIYSYYNVYFETQIDYFNGIKIVRNSAIFIESPMFAVNLVIALLVEMFVKNEHKKSKIIVLAISIITSTSLVGILGMLVILLISFIRNKKVNSISQFFKIIAFPIIVVSILMLSLYLLQNKVDNNTTTASLSLRLDDYKAQFKAWEDRPILGNGYTNNEAIEQYMDRSRFDTVGENRTS